MPVLDRDPLSLMIFCLNNDTNNDKGNSRSRSLTTVRKERDRVRDDN